MLDTCNYMKREIIVYILGPGLVETLSGMSVLDRTDGGGGGAERYG